MARLSIFNTIGILTYLYNQILSFVISREASWNNLRISSDLYERFGHKSINKYICIFMCNIYLLLYDYKMIQIQKGLHYSHPDNFT